MKKKLVFAFIFLAGFAGTASAQVMKETPATDAPATEARVSATSAMDKLTPLNLTAEQKIKAEEVLRTYYPNGLQALSKTQMAQRDQAIETLLYPYQVQKFRKTVAPSLNQN